MKLKFEKLYSGREREWLQIQVPIFRRLQKTSGGK
jgi:hypothetical protein